MAAESVRVWRPDWPCPVGAILAQQRRGAGDPTHRVDLGGRHWRASRTPEGAVTLAIASRPADGEVRARAWGPGAAWALEQLPTLLGADDDWTGFEPRHPIVADLWRRYPHVRIGRTDRVLEALVPAIIEQRVTGKEAFAGFRALVRRYGDAAPGPAADLGLHLPPTAETLLTIPSWRWLGLGIDPARSRAVLTAAAVAGSLDRAASGGPAALDRALRSLPGIGIWTSAEVRQRALGDPDAVSFGDFHISKDVGWALVGEEIDDLRLADLLSPWAPHRGRVPLLVATGGLRRPRRGPRLAPRGHHPRVT